MAWLPVTRYRRVLIDDEDFERCSQLRWHINVLKETRKGRTVRFSYVYAYVFVNGKQKKLLLSRFVSGCGPNQRVRYLNGNHFDCRKENLSFGGERIIPADVVFAKKHILPDIFTMLEDSENGARLQA